MRLFFVLFWESIRIALAELRQNKLRSFLSLLGVTIGIFCIISVLSAVSSMKMHLNDSLSKLGNDFVMVEKWPWAFDDPNYAWWKYVNRPVPDREELSRIQAGVPGCANANLEINDNKEIHLKFGNNQIDNAQIMAVTKEYALMNDLKIGIGRFLSANEMDNGAPLIVLGYSIAKELGNGQASMVLGQWINILGRKMRVVGVFEEQGNSMFATDYNKVSLISYDYYKTVRDIHDKNLDAKIKVDAKMGVGVETLKAQVTRVLRAKRQLRPTQEDNFALNQMSVLKQGFDGIFAALNVGGFLIGFLSLLVGTFGIANILFVSVRERTPQIGIKKAIGAQPFFILLEFLTESVVLCLMGGAIGIGLVYGLMKIAEKALDMTLYLTLGNIGFGLGISVIIGLLAGIIPAWRAAKMDPVMAIRFR
jgi:putative ABC transport system permease protein